MTKDFETPQYKETVGFTRPGVALGLFHPDSLTLVDVNAGRTNFLAGKWILNVEIFGVAWQDLLQRGPKLNPPVTSLPVRHSPPRRGQGSPLFTARVVSP